MVAGIAAGTPKNGITIIEPVTGGIEVQDCSVRNVTNAAFVVTAVSANLDTVVIKNCIASGSIAGCGFLIAHTGASGAGPIVEQCIAEDSVCGFMINSTQGTILNNCIAARHTTAGFIFDSFTDQTVASLCLSQDNSTSGFTVDATRTTFRWCTASNNSIMGFALSGNAASTVIHDCLASNNGSSGLTDGGLSTVTILDSRSQNSATSVNPAYNLNGANDSTSFATVIITS
jgi:parallel beta-helix repeat protein